MPCLILFQGAEPSPVPPALLQLGAGVAVCYIVMLITKMILEFAGKSTKAQAMQDNSSRTEYRLDKLDEEMKERITRTEYESRHLDILRQLTRIEKLLEQLYSTRILFDPSKTGKQGG